MEILTQSSRIVVRPDDIVTIKVRKEWDQPDTLEVAKETVAALIRAVDGKNRGVMSYMPDTHLPKDVLEYYKQTETGAIATALIVASFGAKLMGNIFLKIATKRNAPPVKLFAAEEEAIEWLQGQIKKCQSK